MYQTCIFCNQPLGANEVVEAFPVGRRLAFDSAKGRLWAVCRKCERWNLTPLEERWEAVETCEKLFRGTRIRTSSENIGLARHPEGLELVRIGEPLRPEFAAWRYGDQFGRRRRRKMLYTTGLGAVAVGGWALGGTVGGLAGAGGVSGILMYADMWIRHRRSIRFRPSDGRVRRMNRELALSTRIRPAEDDVGFELKTGTSVLNPRKQEWFTGDDARRAMNAILPSINQEGGDPKTVRAAVTRIGSHASPRQFVDTLVGLRAYTRKGIPGHVSRMPKPTRLALEMALHEEDERRALEGELWRLEQAWREAEEIAAIADDLLLPKRTRQFMALSSKPKIRDGEDCSVRAKGPG